VSYPDIEPTLKKIGGKPTTSVKRGGVLGDLYTLPAILDENGGSPVVVADSLAIAEYLDAKFPERPVLPKAGKALEYAFEEYLNSTMMKLLLPVMLGDTCEIQDEAGKPYFEQTRTEWFGVRPQDMSPEGPVREGHWKALEGGLGSVAAILEKNGQDVKWVAGGNNPTRADFVIASLLMWIKVVSPADWEKRIKHWSGGRWASYMKNTEEWHTVQ
jgi:glutathione S-transferase